MFYYIFIKKTSVRKSVEIIDKKLWLLNLQLIFSSSMLTEVLQCVTKCEKLKPIDSCVSIHVPIRVSIHVPNKSSCNNFRTFSNYKHFIFQTSNIWIDFITFYDFTNKKIKIFKKLTQSHDIICAFSKQDCILKKFPDGHWINSSRVLVSVLVSIFFPNRYF